MPLRVRIQEAESRLRDILRARLPEQTDLDDTAELISTVRQFGLDPLLCARLEFMLESLQLRESLTMPSTAGGSARAARRAPRRKK